MDSHSVTRRLAARIGAYCQTQKLNFPLSGRSMLWLLVALVMVVSVLLTRSTSAQDKESVPQSPTANQIGRLTSVGNGPKRTSFEYDALGRVTRTAHTFDGRTEVFTTSYGYPKQGPTPIAPSLGTVPVSQTFPDAETVSYTYDEGGAQQAILTTPSGGNQQIIVGSVRRNARGQTIRAEYGNNAVTTYDYNPNNLRLRQIKTVVGGNTLTDYTYEFDHNGNVKGIAHASPHESRSATYGYDSLDQLISMTAGGASLNYTYDNIGNLTNKEGVIQTYGGAQSCDGCAPNRGPHALATSAGNVTYNYDANGNMISTSNGTLITWNAENMATRVAQGGVEKNRKSFIGESLWKKVEGGVTTYYLPSVRIENGQYRKFFGSFAERSPDGQLRFYHGDHLGSSTLMTDATGNVIRRTGYFPYGEDRAPTGFTPKYQFNFKEKESTGFYDYGARLYNPATGRWLSADSSIVDGLNRYTYVSNNPLRYIDPTGHNQNSPLAQESVKLVKKVVPNTTMGYKPLESMTKKEARKAITRMIKDGLIDAGIGRTALKMLKLGAPVIDVIERLVNVPSVGGGVAEKGVYFFGHYPDYLAGGDLRKYRNEGARILRAKYLDVSEHRWLAEMNQIFVRQAVAEVYNNTGSIVLVTDIWAIDRNTQYWFEVREMIGSGLVPYQRQMVPAASEQGRSVLDMWRKDPNSIPWVAR